MNGRIERPLDLLNCCRGKTVLVHLKNNKVMEGVLLAFDIHINLVLEVKGKSKKSSKFVKGDCVILVEDAGDEEDGF